MRYLERVGAAYCALEQAKKERGACHKTLMRFFGKGLEAKIPNRDYKVHPTPQWVAAYDRWAEAKAAMEKATLELERAYLDDPNT